MSVEPIAALLFGAVLGYLVHYLVRKDPSAGIEDLVAIIGAILGAPVLKLLTAENQTNWYLVGLGLGFFLYWLALLLGREKVEARKAAGELQTLFPFL